MQADDVTSLPAALERLALRETIADLYCDKRDIEVGLSVANSNMDGRPHLIFRCIYYYNPHSELLLNLKRFLYSFLNSVIYLLIFFTANMSYHEIIIRECSLFI